MRQKDNLSTSVRRTDPRFDRLGSGFGDTIEAGLSLFGGGGRSLSDYSGFGTGSNRRSKKFIRPSSSTSQSAALKFNNANSTKNSRSHVKVRYQTTPSLVTKFKSTKKPESHQHHSTHRHRVLDREQSLLRKNFLSSHCANEKRRRECVKQHLDILRKTCVDSTDSKTEQPYLQTCTTVRLIDAAKQMIDRLMAEEQAYILEKEGLEQRQLLLKGQLELIQEQEYETHNNHGHGLGLDSSGYDSEETLDAISDINLTPLDTEEHLRDLHHHQLPSPRVNVCSAYGPDPIFPTMIKEEMFFDHHVRRNHVKSNGEIENFMEDFPNSFTTMPSASCSSNNPTTTTTFTEQKFEPDDPTDTSPEVLASVIKLEDFQKFLEDTNEFNVHEKMEYLDGCDYIAFEVEV